MEIVTPRGRKIETDNVSAKIVWSSQFQKAANVKLGKGGYLQKLIDSEVLRGTEPYIPMDTGVAKKSGLLNTIIGSGLVVWSTPYIRYIYYGVSHTGKPLQYHGGGIRGKLWAERWKADKLPQLQMMIQKRAGGFTT